MKARILLSRFLPGACIVLLGSCYYDKEELLYPGSVTAVDCSTVTAKFAADVQPIIAAKCATSGCHDNSASGGVILQTHSQISAKKDRVYARAVLEKTMPASGALPPAEIAKLKCWIDSGAPNN
ncbi:MAG: hypothetical protein JNK91_11665 [Ferruginibacter sp.]|nr:hypothetical protein [Ferruginibacter sp.]